VIVFVLFPISMIISAVVIAHMNVISETVPPDISCPLLPTNMTQQFVTFQDTSSYHQQRRIVYSQRSSFSTNGSWIVTQPPDQDILIQRECPSRLKVAFDDDEFCDISYTSNLSLLYSILIFSDYSFSYQWPTRGESCFFLGPATSRLHHLRLPRQCDCNHASS
jgi:hypothetical protein